MKRIALIFACIILAFCVCSCNQSGANTGANSQSSQESISEKVVLETKQYTMFLEDTETVQKISATVYDGEELVESAKVVYEVDDASVAEVQEDGTIIAKGHKHHHP